MPAPTIRIINADVLAGLSQLEDESVNCVVTSPPYWGLRDYGTGRWEGGDPTCDHRSPTMREGRNEDRPKLAGSEATNAAQLILAHNSICGKCGAGKVDQQIGLEKTPEEFVAKLVDVFREVKRVLRKDGVLFLNIGDSYCNTDKWGGGGAGKNGKQTIAPDGTVPSWAVRKKRDHIPGIKPKDLVGIPWMVAFALRADGWYLRQEIIWAKPNPMPESVRDRCTKAHEHIFLLTKSERYFYDSDAIREPSSWDPSNTKMPDGWDTGPGGHGSFHRNGREKGAKKRGHERAHDGFNGKWDAMSKTEQQANGRNKRSVWTIATQPYSEAHFATFPEELPETCILAGCPVGGTVLDPFGGAGTTAVVADRLGRNAILLELNPEYAAMAERRIARERLERGAGTMADVAKAALPLTPLEALMRGE